MPKLAIESWAFAFGPFAQADWSLRAAVTFVHALMKEQS